jgi:hypothetical protein
LRQSRWGAFVGLLAMLLQVLFAAEHASAMAAAVARGGPDGKPMGLLDICTAQGLLRLPAPAGADGKAGAPASNPGGATCAVCVTAATAGNGDVPAAAPAAIIPTQLQIALVVSVADGPVLASGLDRSHPVRAPPTC